MDENPNLIFYILSVIMFIIYGTYTKKNNKIPCDNDLFQIMQRNFIHIDINHFMTNMITFYVLVVNLNKDGITMSILITSILFFSVIIEYLFALLNTKRTCSIGFSGILYGLISIYMLTKRKLDLALISSLGIMVLRSSLVSSKVSLSGHAIGAISGVITYQVMNKFNKN